MSNIRFLRTFIAVARYGSFAAAAEKVALTQAAVSMQMQSLEDDLKRPLFDRVGRTNRLTSIGKQVLPQAERIVALYDSMRLTGLDDEIAGSVSIGAVDSAMGALASVVTELKGQYPRLDVRLFTGKALALAPQVEAGEIDAAVIVEMAGKTPASLEWTPLYSEPLVAIGSSASTHTNAADLLANAPFLRFDRAQRTGALIDRALRHNRLAVNEFLELNSLEVIVELVRQGAGVSVVPLLEYGSWASDPALAVLPLAKDTPRRVVGMLERKIHDRHAVMRVVQDSIRARSQAADATRHP
ncbi:LysR substrate-binding domain-containing protein [Caballeronia sp. LZ062]|uniref:LysR substrate-binding domain-containing protein n=1 Tax=unclassified Caballeronia TaxID=2646786 RepID=UPI002856E13D|nr:MULTISPECIES: LysR substrate-binding domain-containing protein [unclassified Caballeronia]MDR5856459.1 LysR substrate-binding domain-containing protein [Caballeronia sp. LZ050]MDR5873129.1 LysR substrate-binding domain-containing protein [Caballeronia sp. LZ062]